MAFVGAEKFSEIYITLHYSVSIVDPLVFALSRHMVTIWRRK